MANSDLITLGGLSVFKTNMDTSVDEKISGISKVTYTLSKNTDGEIVLTGSDSSTTKVTDENTTYTFTQDGYTLVIKGTDGTDKTITLGGEITKQSIIDALGFTPASTDVATTSANGLMSSTDKTKVDALRQSVISATEPTLSTNDEWLLEY